MNQEQKSLLSWYKRNYRDLPWRKTKDPYAIWISEIMLQQTRAAAVIPFYQRFLERFPNVETLANAPLEEVLESWSGLGYYSRARNIHKAAQQLAKNDFPSSHKALLEIPGFGPYTARAVASFAFGESVAVLDGNVIRLLSRLRNKAIAWWTTKGRRELQALADAMVRETDSAPINQALMEVGATLCLPKNPACLLCPLQASCQAKIKGTIETLPLKKTKRDNETWHVHLRLSKKQERIAILKNEALPFLKGEWLLPATGKLVKTKPKNFHFKHCVTHHEIYVQVCSEETCPAEKCPVEIYTNRSSRSSKNFLKWIDISEVKKFSPFSITTKAIQHAKDFNSIQSLSIDSVPNKASGRSRSKSG